MSGRLLVFGINYAPEPTGAGVATTCIAEALAECGWRVEVVTGIPHYPSWRSVPIPVHLSEELVRVRHRRHYVPRTQSALRRGAYELSWVCSALPDALVRPRPDLVLGIVPSLGGALLAAIAAARHRVPFAVLFLDLMGRAAEQSGVPGAASVAGAVRRVELALARRANRVGVIADGFQDYFIRGNVRHDHVVRVRLPSLEPRSGNPSGWNGSVDGSWDSIVPAETREQLRTRLGWPSDQFVVLYSGSIGYKQALQSVVDAARLATDDAGIRFVLQGDGSQREQLEALARGLRLQNLEFRPLAAPEALSGVLAAADALLIHQRATVRNMSLASKLSMYLASGVPVIAAVAPEDAVAHELRAAGAGLIIDPEDPRRLLDAVAELRRDPQKMRVLGDAGSSFAERVLDRGKAIDGIQALLRGCAAFTC